DYVGQVFPVIEGVQAQAVADLAGDAAHVGIHRRNVDRDVRLGDRLRPELGVHEREAVMVATEIRRPLLLKSAPELAQRQDILAQTRTRRGPGHAEPALDVALDLAAQSEDE